MLKNKKTGIKLFALVLALLMTASIFAGCNNKALQEAIDAAKAQADAANQAAANAQAAADAAAGVANDLQDQLDAANEEIDAQKKANDDLQSDLNKAKETIESIVNTPGTEPPTGIDPNEWDDVTAIVTSTVLAELSQLKAKYLTIRQLWYTEDNYYILAKLFDDAYTALYRATTADGVTEVLTKLADDASKVTSIASEGEAVQAIISSFGDVDTELFTTHEDIVKQAREEYIAWMNTYTSYFSNAGFSVVAYTSEDATLDTITKFDGYVMKTFSIATSTLRYAESKLAVLNNYADKVADAAYEAIDAIVGSASYENIKAQSEAIEAAYELYKIFMVANGGDDSAIAKIDDTDPDNPVVLLSGEDFVKKYVLVLYDNWLAQYMNQAKDYLQTIPAFFMNNDTQRNGGLDDDHLRYYPFAYLDGTYAIDYAEDQYYEGDPDTDEDDDYGELGTNDQQFLNELDRIATLNSAEFLKWSYSGSFKGTLNIEDAYAQVDNVVAKALTEMASTYFNKVVMPVIEEKVAGWEDFADPYLNSTDTDTAYKNFDKAFGPKVVAAAKDHYDGLSAYKTSTYAELDSIATPTNGLTNISDFRVFTVKCDEDTGFEVELDVNDDAETSALIAALKDLKKTVKSVTAYYTKAEIEFFDLMGFYEFKKALSIKVQEYANAIGSKSGAYIDLVNTARVNGGAKALTSTELTNYNSAVVALGTAARDAIMALDYDTYTATTYQAVNGSSKKLYLTTDDKFTTTAGTNKPLDITLDKLVVAKDAAVDAGKQYTNQMFNALLDLARTQVKAHIDAAKAPYVNYEDNESLTLQTDLAAYVTYLVNISDISAVTAFKTDNFSNKNNKVTAGTIDDLKGVDGYYVETLGTNSYIIHISGNDYTSENDIVMGDGGTSFKSLANTKIDEFHNLVTYDYDVGADTTGAYGNLEKVRLLAYHKDDVIMALGVTRDDVKGTWNAKDSNWTDAPKYEYIYGSSRAARYLAEVDAVYGRLVEKVKAITMLTSGVNSNYTTAVGEVNGIVNEDNIFKVSDNKKASSSNDDFSFKVAYDRYYATNPDGTSVYNWAAYNG